MASASAASQRGAPEGPGIPGGLGHLWRVLVPPVSIAIVAVVVASLFGRPLLGLILSLGVALGAVNGLLMEAATARMTPEHAPSKGAIAKSSLGRLGVVTVIALLLAVLLRPDGWLLLLGLAGYQLLVLAGRLQTAAAEARVG